MEKIKLVDVGARDGINERWMPIKEYIEVVAFEPDPVECEKLNAENYDYDIRYLPYALGSDAGQENLYVTRQPGCSSLLKPNQAFASRYHYADAMQIMNEFAVKVCRLDNVLQGMQPDVIKIDTQGTELDILMGAGSLIDKVLAVEVEVEFVELYKGQPLFADVDTYLRSKGLTLRGLRRSYWRDHGVAHINHYGGQIVHGDALYFRMDKIDCPVGHLILHAYRQYDLLAQFHRDDLVPRESWPLRMIGKILPWSNREMRRFVDRLRSPGVNDWHDPDFF